MLKDELKKSSVKANSVEVGSDEARVYRRYVKLKKRRKKLTKDLKIGKISVLQFFKAVGQNTVKIDDKMARMIQENRSGKGSKQ